MFDRDGKRKYLNKLERRRFLEATNLWSVPGEEAFLETLLFTGCRISEALSLTSQRLDGDDGTLVLETLKRRGNGHHRSVPVPRRLLELIYSVALETERNAQASHRIGKRRLTSDDLRCLIGV